MKKGIYTLIQLLKIRFSHLMPVILLLSTASCAPVISKQIRDQIRPDIAFKDVLNDPEHYKGQIIILSGVIIETKNTKEGTLLQVLQRPAGFRGQPKDVDETEGRFLALYDRYLDAEVYTKGREVTIGGEIEWKRTLTLPSGEIAYTYPLIQVKEIYLWPIVERYYSPYPYYYYPGYYYPWWWGHPVILKKTHTHKKK